MNTRISWKKRPQLQKEYNENDAYLTADNINEMISGINNNYNDLTAVSSALETKINTNNTNLNNKTSDLQTDIQNLSTTVENLKDINDGFDIISNNLDILSANFNNLNYITSSYYSVDSVSSYYSVSSQNAKTANIALSANMVMPSEVERIIAEAKKQISTDSDGSTSTPASLKNLTINTGLQQIIYNGSDHILIDAINTAVSSQYSNYANYAFQADIAASANILTNKLIFKDTNNNTREYNGSQILSLVDGINYATSSKYALSANYATQSNQSVSASILKNKIILKNKNNQICQFNGNTTLDLSEGINYATNSNLASTALSATSLINKLAVIDANGNQHLYDGTTPIIINSISHASTADSLTNGTQFNITISSITFPLTGNNTITYDGFTQINLTDNLLAKQATIANGLKHSISFTTSTNDIYSFDGTTDLVIDSILNAKYSENATYATYDGNGNIISETYQPIIKDVQNSYIIIICGNENRRLTNSTINNSSVLAQYKKVQTFDFDKSYSLIVTDNKIYPGGNQTISDTFKNGFNCNKELNKDYISDLTNISYTFILNKCCAAISNKKLYVWGRSDNYWYGLHDAHDLNNVVSNNLATPTEVKCFYTLTSESIYDKCIIQNASDGSIYANTIDPNGIISNNLSQLTWEDLQHILTETEAGITKIVKGGIGCGALAIDENGKIYGCGKNKNQIFGRQFKNNCIFKTWVKLPLNNIINDKITDIQSAHTDTTDAFLILTQSGKIYITGYMPAQVTVIKMPIFVSSDNSYDFKNAASPESLRAQYLINDNKIHCDPWYTGEIELISGQLYGWYCWGIATNNSNNIVFGDFKNATISPSGIAAIDNYNLNAILYEGHDIFTAAQTSTKYLFSGIQSINNNNTYQYSISDITSFNQYDIQITKDSIFLKYQDIIYGASLTIPGLYANSTTLLVGNTGMLHVQQIGEYENVQLLKVNKCDDDTILMILTNKSTSQNVFKIEETILNNGQAVIECSNIDEIITGLSASVDNSNVWTRFWPVNNIINRQHAIYSTNNILKDQLVTIYNGMDTYIFKLISNNIYFNNIMRSETGLTNVSINTFDNSIISSTVYILFQYINTNSIIPAATPSAFIYQIPAQEQQLNSSIQLNLAGQVAGITAISAIYQNNKTKNYEFFIFDGLSQEDAPYNPSAVSFDYAEFKKYFTTE